MKKNKSKLSIGKIIFGWLPAFLCAGIILYLSSKPATALPSMWFKHMDKMLHAGEYGALTLLIFRALLWPQYHGRSRRRILRDVSLTLFICSVFSMLDEFHQVWIPGRTATFLDWIADMAGVIAALAFSLYCIWPSKRR